MSGSTSAPGDTVILVCYHLQALSILIPWGSNLWTLQHQTSNMPSAQIKLSFLTEEHSFTIVIGLSNRLAYKSFSTYLVFLVDEEFDGNGMCMAGWKCNVWNIQQIKSH